MTGWVILAIIIAVALLLIWAIAERPHRDWRGHRISNLDEWED